MSFGQLFIGLNLTAQWNIATNLKIETYSKEAVQLILDQCSSVHPLDSFILNCRSRITSFANIKITHITRQQNYCANILTKEGRKKKLPPTIYDEVPASLYKAYNEDKETSHPPASNPLSSPFDH